MAFQESATIFANHRTTGVSSPILPTRSKKVFYGWWVAVTLMLVTLIVYGMGAYGFTLFIVPLSDEFHWSRAIAGGLIAAFWFASPLTPAGGVLILRFGVRRLVVLGCVLEGVCFLLLPHAHQLWQFFGLRAVMGLGKILIAICPGVVLNRWFSRHYPVALAIAMSGFHLGGLLTVPITRYLIETIGWREGANVLGISLLITMIPLSVYVLRIDRPEDLGLEKDGSTASTAERLHADVREERPGTFSAAVLNANRLPALWFLAALTICYYTAYNGLMGLMVLYLRDLGFGLNDAAKALSLTAGCALIGLLSIGFVVKAIGLSKSLFIVLLLFLAGVVGFTCLDGSKNGPLLIMSVVLFGIAIGCCDILQISFAQSRTSEGDFNHIYCVWYGLSLVGFLLGPSAVGALSMSSGGYHLPFVMLSCLAGVVFLLGLVLIFGRWSQPAR
jgi:MFS family permease